MFRLIQALMGVHKNLINFGLAHITLSEYMVVFFH